MITEQPISIVINAAPFAGTYYFTGRIESSCHECLPLFAPTPMAIMASFESQVSLIAGEVATTTSLGVNRFTINKSLTGGTVSEVLIVSNGNFQVYQEVGSSIVFHSTSPGLGAGPGRGLGAPLNQGLFENRETIVRNVPVGNPVPEKKVWNASYLINLAIIFLVFILMIAIIGYILNSCSTPSKPATTVVTSERVSTA